MPLKPFWIKKFHLGMTGDEVKEILQSAKGFNVDAIDVSYSSITESLRGTVQTNLPDAETAQAAMVAYYNDHDIVIAHASEVPFLGDFEIRLHKSSSFQYFALFRVSSTNYFVYASLSIESEEAGSETCKIMLGISMVPLAELTGD